MGSRLPCLRISGILAGAGGEYNLGVVVFGGWEHPGLTAPPELSQVLPCATERPRALLSTPDWFF